MTDADQQPRIDIPFNRPYVTGAELPYIQQAIENGQLSGNGPFARRCGSYLESALGAAGVLLTHSCTGALEMAALLADVGPGDEVIVPSFTFSSSATAFALRGATLVFVDIRPDTLNLDESLVESAITERTKVICAVHYAGVSCDMDVLEATAARHDLLIIEDAAQGFGAYHRGRALGGIGRLGALSFHETKNVISGEGGALIVNDGELLERAEILHEKGTDRSRFFRGQVDKYTWVDVGSSFVASEMTAAFLWAQLERAEEINARRMEIWSAYHVALEELEEAGSLRRPVIPPEAQHNAHLYYLLLPTEDQRDGIIAGLRDQGIQAVFHYQPLHSAPAGRRFGRAAGDLGVTDDTSRRLLRLPLWPGMRQSEVERVIGGVRAVVSGG